MIESVTLTGHTVRLVPLSMDHLDAFCEVGLHPSIWEHNAWPIRDRAGMETYIRTALNNRDAGHQLPFATTLKETGDVIGSTRFAAIDRANRRLEIGWTWITPAWQRTAVNTEAKLLMLRHAFGEAGCRRVEWKTDALNQQSRNAILRLGAQFEGTLRAHMIRENGTWRDTVYFSLLDDEWPAAEQKLVSKLSAYGHPGS